MDASHFLVGGLTAIFFALLVLIEIRSRRNTAAEQKQQSVPMRLAEAEAPPNERRGGRP